MRDDRGAIPAFWFPGRDGIAQANLQFVTGDEAENQFLPARVLHFGRGQRWSDIHASVMRPAERDVIIVVQIAKRHRVQERGLVAGDLAADSDDRGLRVSALQRDHPARHTHWLRVKRAEGAAQRIESDALGAGDDIGGQIFIAEFRQPARDILGYRRTAANAYRVALWGCRSSARDRSGQ